MATQTKYDQSPRNCGQIKVTTYKNTKKNAQSIQSYLPSQRTEKIRKSALIIVQQMSYSTSTKRGNQLIFNIVFLASRCKIHKVVVRRFSPDRYTNTSKEMDKSFVNTVRESLIKPTPGTRFLFIKYQQGFSSTLGYLIQKPIVKTQ